MKLKTENWKYCSKIIFKCVNSTVGPILMKKLLKNGICGSMNSTLMHCLLWKSQHLWLLFNKQYINSNHVTPKRVKKKKKVTKTQLVKRRRGFSGSKHTLKVNWKRKLKMNLKIKFKAKEKKKKRLHITYTNSRQYVVSINKKKN